MATQDITIPKKEIAPGVFTTGGVATIPQNTHASATISAQDLKPQAPIDLSSTFQTPTDTGAGLVASGNVVQQNLQKYLDLSNQEQTPTANNYDNLISELGMLGDSLTGRGASQTQAEQQTGFTQANKELADLNANYLSKYAEYDKLNADIEAGAGRKGLTTTQMTGQQGAVNRARQSELGLLQAQILGKQGQVTQAQNAANRAVDLMYQDREAVYNTKVKQLDLIKDKLTKEETKQKDALTYALDKEKTAISDAKEISKLAAQNGAPMEVLTAIGNSSNYNEMVKNAGQYLATSQNEVVKLDNGSTVIVNKRTGAIVSRLGGAKPTGDSGLIIRNVGGSPVDGYTLLTGDDPYNIAQRYGTDMAGLKALNPKITDWTKLQPGAVINVPSKTAPQKQALQTILASSKFTKDQKADVVSAINSGQDPLTVIKNQAKLIAKAQGNNDINNYETAKGAMQELDKNLKEFYRLGGETSYLKGNTEQVLNKLGQVEDPKLVDLAVQIASQLQVYRNAVSGTAYSVQEGKQISSIFPGIDKSQGLNTAIMSGRMKAFDTTIDAAYGQVLGEDTYKQLKSSSVKQLDPKENVTAYGDKYPEQRQIIIDMQKAGRTIEEINNWVNQQEQY